MDIQAAIKRICEGSHLSAREMEQVMQQVMTGGATDAQIGGLLIGLRLKGETVDEITGAANVMRQLATPVSVKDRENLVDVVGTGGDGSNTFNISTASAFVTAAAGARVAKHGNRSVSSSTGSADLLEAAGVNLTMTAEQVGQCIEEVGVGFMFAPAHHSAMKHAIGPRKEMGVRTIFNVLGPLTNPAGAPSQLTGVFSRELVRPIAEVFKALGSEHVMVVHSADGMDEISVCDKTYVAELKDGQIREYTVEPEQFGLTRGKLSDLAVSGAAESLAVIEGVLNDQTTTPAQQASRDIVALNSGAAIYVSGVTQSLEQGVALAQDVIASGQAKQKLTDLVDASKMMLQVS